MPLLDENTGRVVLPDGPTLSPDMSKARILELFTQAAGNKPNFDLTGDELLIPFPAFAVHGGAIAPICQLSNGRLTAVWLYAYPKPKGDGRRLLFQLLMAKDPSPDTRGAVTIGYPFGTAQIACDPRLGQSTLYIYYR